MFPKAPKGSCRASSRGPQSPPTAGDSGVRPSPIPQFNDRSMHRMKGRKRANRPRSRGIQDAIRLLRRSSEHRRRRLWLLHLSQCIWAAGADATLFHSEDEASRDNPLSISRGNGNTAIVREQEPGGSRWIINAIRPVRPASDGDTDRELPGENPAQLAAGSRHRSRARVRNNPPGNAASLRHKLLLPRKSDATGP